MTPEAIVAQAREAAVEELHRLRAALAEADSIALLRIITAASGTNGSEEDRLLTLPEVATVLGVPEDYAYTLARQRKIPTVRLPGLKKGGKEREGKYVRVRLMVLRAWAKEHESKGIDGAFITVIKLLHDRPRSAKNPKGPRALSGGVREARGRDLRDSEQVGDGGEPHPGAHGEAHQAPRKVG